MDRFERGTESPNPSPRRMKFEQLRADYELFLQTFEKPTQIYRYVRSKHAISPLFLHRTLSYMKGRRTKRVVDSKKKRQELKLDDLLEKRNGEVLDILEKEDDACGEKKENFLNITFGGFFHGPEFGEEIFHTTDLSKQTLLKDEFVEVNLQLIKVFARKKKGEEFPVDCLELGKCTSLWNPRTQMLSTPTTCSISIPRKAFTEDGKTVKTHILSIQVTVPISQENEKRFRRKKSAFDEASDKETEDSNSNLSEPPLKKVKRQDDDSSDDGSTQEQNTRVYTAELIVFDKNKRCLLTNGEYELLLHSFWGKDGGEAGEQQRKKTKNGYRNKLGPFEMFTFGPTIKFKLCWKDKPVTPFQTRSAALIQKLSKQSRMKKNQPSLELTPKDQPRSQIQRVFYQFIYNNNTRQQTEARDDYYCPWCSINCLRLYSLLKHLKTCHGRFIFMYTSLSKGARIDVCINENYQSTCSGGNRIMPASGQDFPCKRKQITEVIVARPFKDKEDLQEFTEPDCTDIDGIKPFFKGQDRVYYHSDACIPMRPQEHDFHKEEEKTPDWLKIQTEYMIDEFTDVNEGEKELMKMWNMHIMKGCYISDFQLPLACKSFVEEHSRSIVEKRLSSNLLLHLVNLCEFSLISQPSLLSTVSAFKNILNEGFKDS